MHKSVERIVIAIAILIAALYAVLNFWPEQNPAPEPSVSVEGNEQVRSEPPRDTKRIEATVISHLIQLGSAQLSFRGMKKRFGAVEELVQEHLLNAKFSQGAIIEGYQYTVRARGDHFVAHGDPAPGPGRHYFIDESLDLRYDDNGRASSTSPYLSYSKNQDPSPAEERAAPPGTSPGPGKR